MMKGKRKKEINIVLLFSEHQPYGTHGMIVKCLPEKIFVRQALFPSIYFILPGSHRSCK